jgi:hypothetical protein
MESAKPMAVNMADVLHRLGDRASFQRAVVPALKSSGELPLSDP